MGAAITSKETKVEMNSQSSDTEVETVAIEAGNVPGYDPDLQLTSSDTRRAVLKVDFLLLPFIMLCFCFLQFDRTNIGNALTDTLAKDIHVDNTSINLAQTLFTVGFVITELPFNLISKYMGPERFLPITMILWGIATWSQIFIKNATGLCLVRFFIGALEGGYIPGFALYLSKYYTNQELALRYALFWASNSFGGILGGPLSIGLLSLGGRGGLHGWQWLFLLGTVPIPLLPLVTYMNYRGCFDLLSWSCCILISASQCCTTKTVLRKVLQHLYKTRRICHCESCPS